MGWWGCGVTDGDTPQDILGDFHEKIGICQLVRDDEAENDPTEEELKAEYLTDREKVRAFPWKNLLEEGEDEEDRRIRLHCIGHLYLEYQLSLPDELHKLVIEACDEEIEFTREAGGWKDKEERITAVEQFKSCIQKQDGDGLVVSSLFYEAELNGRTLWD